MSEVTGLLHGPELPASGVPTRVHFRGDYLRVVRPDGSSEDIAAQGLQVSVTGFNEDTLQLAWERGGQTHAVTLSDPAAQRALLDAAPEGVAAHLRKGHSAVHYHRRKWNVVIGAVVGVALLLLVGWWQSERITAWIANRVSLETEIGIGEQALEQLQREHVLTQEGTAAAAVADIGSRLTKGSRYAYRWYISDDREVNAYALPGGIIIVTRGMIEAAGSADELAGVLAHEGPGAIRARHQARRQRLAAGQAEKHLLRLHDQGLRQADLGLQPAP